MQLLSSRIVSAAGAALVASVLLIGAAPAAEVASKDSILGKWNLDSDAMIKMMEKQVADGKLPKEQLPLLKGVIGSMKMTVEFKGDGTMSVAVNTLGKSQEKQGTWSVLSSKANKLTLNTKVDDKADEVTITVDSKDSIVLHPPKGAGGGGFEGMPLKRAKP